MTDIYRVQVLRKIEGTDARWAKEVDESTTAQSADGALKSIVDIRQQQALRAQAEDATYENETGPRSGGVWAEHPLHG
jgi:hypothetical protein